MGMREVVDTLLGSTGQQRSEWLDRNAKAADETASYYLGPAYDPIKGIARLLSAASPGTDMMDMAQSSADLMGSKGGWDTAEAIGGLGAATLGMFFGPAAKIADRGALEIAEAMAERGDDARKIWGETGWFKGVDDKWRFEADDSAMSLGSLPLSRLAAERTARAEMGEASDLMRVPLDRRKAVMARTKEMLPEIFAKDARPAEQAISHPTMWSAYPEIARTSVSGNVPPGYIAAFQPEANTVFVNSDEWTRGDLEGSLLHEMQHRIQQQEGFAQGGNLATFRDPVALQQDVGAEMERSARLYNSLAGEVEARNVARRREWPLAQRRAIPPWETEDVPREQQIVRKYGLLLPAAGVGGMVAAGQQPIGALLGQQPQEERY